MFPLGPLTCPQFVRHANRTLVVFCVAAGGETVAGVVGHLNDFLLCLEAGDDNHGTENFVFHDLTRVSVRLLRSGYSDR